MHQCYVGRYWKVGGTYGVIIPPHIRHAMKLVPGDLMLMVVHEDLIIMRRARQTMVTDGKTYKWVPVPAPKVDLRINGGIQANPDRVTR